MVLPSNIVPPNAGWVARETQSIWTRIRELSASVATSLSPQVRFLLDQSDYAICINDRAWQPTNLTTAAGGDLPFDPDYDPVVTVTPSSTGRVRVDFGSHVGLEGDPAGAVTVTGGVWVEALDGSATVVASASPAWLSSALIPGSSPRWPYTQATVMRSAVLDLTPGVPVTIRTRARYQTDIPTDPVSIAVYIQDVWIATTKLGI